MEASVGDSDPYGIDVQLSLYVCYELHYRGFAGVDNGWEWNPGLLHLRPAWKRPFLSAVRHDVGDIGLEDTAASEMERLSVEPVDGSGPSYFLRDKGTWEQMREYFVHRSLYHLKRAIRTPGRSRGSPVRPRRRSWPSSTTSSAVGRSDQVHQQLFADLMVAAGLDGQLPRLHRRRAGRVAGPGEPDVPVRLHRKHRGCAVGHFASTEITSSRLTPAGRGLGAPWAPETCVAFYREHVEADAVHEQVVRSEVVGDLVSREPALNGDVIFGIRATRWWRTGWPTT